jgi:hypothetical protein
MVNSNANNDPFPVTKSTSGASSGIGDSTQDSRYDIGALAAPAAGNTLQWAKGVAPSGMSGGTLLDFQVTAAGGMAVTINFGTGQVGRNNLGPYLVSSPGTQNVTIGAANPSNPRIDYVCMRCADPDTAVDGAAITQTWYPVVYPGTPAGAPVGPSSSLKDGDLFLAAITVRANTSSIAAGDIADQRTAVVARGGITPKLPQDTRPGAYDGQYRDNWGTYALERWIDSQSAWIPVATPAQWSQYTPRLLCTGTSTDINIGTGAQRVGHYQQVGKMLTFNLNFVWGTSPYNGGTGGIYSLLPAGFTSAANMPQWVQCHGQFRPAGAPAPGTVDLPGQALIPANSTTIQPWFPVDVGGAISPTAIMSNSQYAIAYTAGTVGTGVPNFTTGFPEGGYITITGMIEIQ